MTASFPLPITDPTLPTSHTVRLLLALLALAGELPAQERAEVRTVLSAHGAASGGIGTLLGSGWRELWLDTVQVPRFDATALGSGVTRVEPAPVGRAGVLVLRDSAGTAWRLLMAAVDPVTPTMPPDLRYSALADLFDDLLVTVHPTAPLVAEALYRAAGLPVLGTSLVLLQEGQGAPEGLELLAGQPMWLERAPELDGQPWERFEMVIPSDSLATLAATDPRLRVDAASYLAARLVDVVVGDRDRRPMHWLWGLDRGTWIPIGIRHEQAMLRASGFGRYLLGAAEPGVVAFSAGMPDVDALMARSFRLDRRLLGTVPRARWDSVTMAVWQALDDRSIAAAVRRMPGAHVARVGAFLDSALALRRDELPRISARLRQQVARYAEVVLTDAPEVVELERDAVGNLLLRVRAAGQAVLDHQFAELETEEVRLFLAGGDDTVRLASMDRAGVGVRVIGGEGTQRVEVAGGEVRRVVVYGARGSTRLEPRGAVRVVPRAAGFVQPWPDSGGPARSRDWGVQRNPLLHVDLSDDLGFLAGLGMEWNWYGFGEAGARQRVAVSAAYATRPAAPRLAAAFERRNLLRNAHFRGTVLASGIEVVRYFGLGNETPYDEEIDQEFYRAPTRELAVTAQLGVSARPERELWLGPTVVMTNVDTTGNDRLVERLDPYGGGEFVLAGLLASWVRRPVRPGHQAGVHASLAAEAEFFPGWGDATGGGFGGLRGRIEGGWLPTPGSRVVLAGRVGGAVLWGDVPFIRVARLGGPSSLRGYETDRFAGDRGALFASLEARLRLVRWRVSFAPLDLGVFAFGDAGRVYATGESSRRWHPAVGGGLWVSPALGWLPAIDAMLGRIEVATGDEGTEVSLGTGFRF